MDSQSKKLLQYLLFSGLLVFLMLKWLCKNHHRRTRQRRSTQISRADLDWLIQSINRGTIGGGGDGGGDRGDIDVNGLPTFLYGGGIRSGGGESSSKREFEFEGEYDCAVCLCPLQANELVKLLPACNHIFHATCIDPWLLSRPQRTSTATCPLCRTPVALPPPLILNSSVSPADSSGRGAAPPPSLPSPPSAAASATAAPSPPPPNSPSALTT